MVSMAEHDTEVLCISIYIYYNFYVSMHVPKNVELFSSKVCKIKSDEAVTTQRTRVLVPGGFIYIYIHLYSYLYLHHERLW